MKSFKLLMLCAALVGVSACTDEKGARHTVEAYGFTDIKITGNRWTGCGEDDTYSTGFEATNPRGQRISGVVCSGGGWGKSGTLRID